MLKIIDRTRKWLQTSSVTTQELITLPRDEIGQFADREQYEMPRIGTGGQETLRDLPGERGGGIDHDRKLAFISLGYARRFICRRCSKAAVEQPVRSGSEPDLAVSGWRGSAVQWRVCGCWRGCCGR